MVAHPQLGCLGLSHQAAPVAVREQLSLASSFLERVRNTASFEGFALLATCNRVEFYGHIGPGSEENAHQAIRNILSDTPGVDLDALEPYLYQHDAMEAARHLARVAAGLDSMVLGEPQILGQVGASLRRSEAHDLATPMLAALFNTALKAGRRARRETALSRNPVSVASVVVDLLRREAGSVSEQHVTIVGLGEMGRLVAKILHEGGVGHLTFVNRSVGQATAMAQRLGGRALELSELKDAIAASDAVISTSRAPHLLITPRHIQGRDAARPIVLIDLAVPRDIDPKVAGLNGAQLFDIDDLRASVAASLELRREEIPDVEQIVEEEIAQFSAHVRAMAVEPVIAGLRRKAEAIRRQELARTLGAMDSLSPEAEEQLRYFSHTLVNKLLHEPTLRLRQRASDNGAEHDTALVRTLFAL